MAPSTNVLRRSASVPDIGFSQQSIAISRRANRLSHYLSATIEVRINDENAHSAQYANLHTSVLQTLRSYVHQHIKPQSQNFAIHDLHSKSITIGRMQRGAGTIPRCIRPLGRGARTVYRIIYPAAITVRISYETHLPKPDPHSYAT